MNLMTNESVAMVLAGLSAFAAIMALAMPSEADPRLQARMRSVARERAHLREKRLVELAARSKAKVRQDGPALIARLSVVMPLLPGDVIFTGTPSGVGMGLKPPRYLAPGDEVVTFVKGIGEMRHRFVAA